MNKEGLTLESAKILTKKDGAFVNSRRIGEVKIVDVRLSDAAAKSIGRRGGRYVTLYGSPRAAGMTASAHADASAARAAVRGGFGQPGRYTGQSRRGVCSAVGGAKGQPLFSGGSGN